jgi:tetratricopeptide (TPR) repeat protein
MIDKKLLIIISCIAFSLILWGNGFTKVLAQSDLPTCRIIFATELDKDYRPLSEVYQIYLNEEKLFIHFEWYNLKPQQIYDYKCVLYDGAHNILYTFTNVFKPAGESWMVTHYYQPRINIDKPGQWVTEVYVNNQKISQKTLIVVPPQTKDILSIAYAKLYHNYPGGQELSENDQQQQISLANILSEEGFAYYKAKKDDLAIEKYQEALIHYASAEIYYRYGNSLSNIPRLEDAIKAYQIAIELNYDKPYLVYYNIACIYSRMKDSKDSFVNLESAINNGYSNFSYIEKDTDLTWLRSQPEWKNWRAKHQK